MEDRPARDRFRDWIKESGLKKRAVADRIGVHYGAITKWLSGDRVPQGAARMGIEAMTGIPASDWTEGK